MQEKLAREQFAEDFCLVVDNESDAWHEMMETVEQKGCKISAVSDHLRDEFEGYISQVVERERELGNETGALLISQMLIGWGSSAFDSIAKHYIDTNLEARLVSHLSSVLKSEI